MKGELMFKDRNGQTLIKLPGEIDGNEFQIRNLQDCIVYLLDYSSSLKVTNCKGSKFFLGPVSKKACFIDCINCEITVVSSNLELDRVSDSQLNVYHVGELSVKNCWGLVFAPYNFKYSYLRS
jgi:protein XRP2